VLVRAAVAVPDLDLGAVGGALAGHVQAQAGAHADDGAVGVDGPAPVGAGVAVADDALAVVVLDESGQEKKGTSTCGVKLPASLSHAESSGSAG
jgi:hypothetical protein